LNSTAFQFIFVADDVFERLVRHVLACSVAEADAAVCDRRGDPPCKIGARPANTRRRAARL
jgi:hypothetical protein